MKIDGIWVAKDMVSLDKPEGREIVKIDREGTLSTGRLHRAIPFARAVAEVRFQ